MKRIICFCICFLFAAAFLPAGAAKAYDDVIMSENFEGSTPTANFEYSAQVDTTGKPEALSEEQWKSHGTAISAGLSSGKMFAFKDTVMANDEDAKNIDISFDIMLSDYANIYIGSWLKNTSGLDLPRIFSFTSAGNIELWQRTATNTANYNKYKSYELNRWYSISMLFDFTKDSYSLYINGDEITTNTLVYPEKDFTSLYKFRIDFGSTSSGNYLYLDNIVASRPAAFKLTSQSVAQNTVGVPVNGTIDFVFNNAPQSVKTAEITLTAGDGNVSYPDAYCNDKTLTVNFSGNPLLFNTQYTLTVPKTAVTDGYSQQLAEDISLSFVTMKEGLTAEMPKFKNASGFLIDKITGEEDVLVKTTVWNYTTSDLKGAALIVSAFDENGLCKVYIDEKDVVAKDYKELSVSLSKDEVKGKTLKAICVSDIASLVPINSGYSEISATEFKEYSGEIAKQIAEITQTTVSNEAIEATVTGTKGGLALVSVLSENNSLLAAEPIILSESGSGTYSYELSKSEQAADKEVTYYLKATSTYEENSVKKPVYYINDIMREKIADEINDASSGAAAGEVVKNYKNSFNLPENRFSDAGFSVLYEQRPYGNYTEAVAMLDKAYTLLEELNGLLWSEMTEFLENNSDIVLYGYDEEYEKYSDLSSNRKNSVNQTILNNGTVADFSEFRENFVEALIAGTQSGGSGNSGGSGGKKGSTSVSMTQTALPKVNTENEAVNISFSDINEAKWAEEFIYGLRKKNIVSGYEDGTFKPNESVKREEFLKMLVSSLGIEAENGEYIFADAKDGAWYIPYLNAGLKHGIVKGNDAGKFGVGENITREDAAVMLWRILQTKEVNEKNSAESFTDADKISDYAKEAVEKLNTFGVISGMDNGGFAPKEALSRAQSAKILYRLCEITEG